MGITVGAVIIIICCILMLRVRVVVAYDSRNKKLILLYKILFLTFGKDPDPNSKISKFIKKIIGIDRLQGEAIKASVEEDGISKALKELATLIYLLAGKLIWLLERARLDKFKLNVLCGGEDAADTAMEYGLSCAVVYPLAGYIESVIDTKESGKDIAVVCDFDEESYFDTEICVSVRIIYAVHAAIQNLYDRAEAQQQAGGNK